MHVRLQLADARITLRAKQDEFDLITADAEQRMTDAAGGPKGLGANAEDRARVLRLALHDDEAYREALDALRAAQAEVDRHHPVFAERQLHRRANVQRERGVRRLRKGHFQQLGVRQGHHQALQLPARMTLHNGGGDLVMRHDTGARPALPRRHHEVARRGDHPYH
jgi:hypothetical protein